MNIICNETRPFSDKIFNGEKPFIFLRSNGRVLNDGIKVFIYETKKANGCGKVIGEAIANKIVTIPYPIIGPCRYFLRKYAQLTNNKEAIDALNKLGDFNLSNYRTNTILSFLFCGDILEEAIKNDEYPPQSKDIRSYSPGSPYVVNTQRSNDFLFACDEWLNSLGFYDDFEKSHFDTSLELVDIQRYVMPIPISEFKSKSNKQFKKVTNSFVQTIN